MDVASLYTNIDHEEDANACFKALQKGKNKKTSPSLLKRLILLVLGSNIFRFNKQIYKQVKGTAMETPLSVIYANIFLDCFETNMLNEYEKKTGLRPFLWLRYIDVFFILNHDESSLKDFIEFCNNYSDNKKMNSKIKFESSVSKEFVNFLDVTVKLSDGQIKTSVYSKPTDAYLYLNSRSSHTNHVVKNLPKGQFIRVRRICSEINDFNSYARIMRSHFISRGYDEKHLNRTIEMVSKMDRLDLL